MPGFSLCCDSSSSWICIALFKPRRRKGRCSSEEFADRISAIVESFNRTGFVKSAVPRATNSNHVAVLSVWEKDIIVEEPFTSNKVIYSRNLLDHARSVIMRQPRRYCPGLLSHGLVKEYRKAMSSIARTLHMSWYEVSCWESKEKVISSSPSKFSSQPQVHDRHEERLPVSSHTPSPSSSSSSSSKCSSFSHATQCATPFCHILLPGDIVHLRIIMGGKAVLQDTLSYSCLAILKSYFQQTDGLNAYYFYNSLDSTGMVGMGIWESFDAALACINVPNGPPEEVYWRSLGAKTKLAIFEVVSVAME